MDKKRAVTANEIKWTRRVNWYVKAILAVGIAFMISVQVKMLQKGDGINGEVVYSMFLLIASGVVILRHNLKFLKEHE